MELQRIQLLILCLAVCISSGYAKGPRKIIRGNDALDREFPYQVLIEKKNGGFCGGSIIDATHILTAAHCVVSENFKVIQPEEVQVITGVIDRSQKYRNQNVFPVNRVTYHGDYNPLIRRSPGYFADIAILRLAIPIPFNSRQQPISLSTSEIPPETLGITSGWGTTYYDNNNHRKNPRMLQKLQVITVGLDECNKAYEVYGTGAVAYGQICAIADQGSAVCKGDSGGPLVHNNTLIGVVSWGIGCAEGIPDVFTDVFAYLPWIRDVVRVGY